MHGGYHVGDDHIDFSVSLNPYRAPETELALEEALAEARKEFCRYPDIDQSRVRRALSQAEGVSDDCVIAGGGASEMIMAATRAISPHVALLIDPCFTGYRYALNSLKECKIRHYQLKEEAGFALTEDILPALSKETDIVFLCDPWNPTGQNIDEGLLEMILELSERLEIKVVLDRSFYMLSEASLKCTCENTSKLINRYDNLIIINSFTKFFSLPGIRMGYAISSKNNVDMLKKQLPEWNLSVLSNTLMSRLAPVKMQGDFHKKSLEYIKQERSFLRKKLSDLGIKVYESDSNFILIRTQKDINEKLSNKKIVIRKCDDFEGLGDGFFRIAIRSHEDNLKLLDALGNETRP